MFFNGQIGSFTLLTDMFEEFELNQPLGALWVKAKHSPVTGDHISISLYLGSFLFSFIRLLPSLNFRNTKTVLPSGTAYPYTNKVSNSVSLP